MTPCTGNFNYDTYILWKFQSKQVRDLCLFMTSVGQKQIRFVCFMAVCSKSFFCLWSPPRWRLRPRVLRDVSEVDLSCSVLGQALSMPLCAAATAMQRMAHADGETATARGRACRPGSHRGARQRRNYVRSVDECCIHRNICQVLGPKITPMEFFCKHNWVLLLLALVKCLDGRCT